MMAHATLNYWMEHSEYLISHWQWTHLANSFHLRTSMCFVSCDLRQQGLRRPDISLTLLAQLASISSGKKVLFAVLKTNIRCERSLFYPFLRFERKIHLVYFEILPRNSSLLQKQQICDGKGPCFMSTGAPAESKLWKLNGQLILRF